MWDIVVAFTLVVRVVFAAQRPLYKDPNASIEARVADLLPRMTVQEKVAQMYGEWVTAPGQI